MDSKEIQKRIDAIPTKMSAKGLRKPEAQFSFRSNAEPQAYARWNDKKKAYDNGFKFITADSPEEALKKLEEWLEGLPSAEDARRDEFLSALGGVIDLGKELGIDVDYVNPLVSTMKRLSENALTFSPIAAE